MAHEGTDVGAERLRIEPGAIAGGIVPGLCPLQQPQHAVAWQCLDAGEQVGAVLRVGIDHGDGAGTKTHGGHAVSDALAKCWRCHDLGIVVGMNVEETGCHPAARGIDQLGAVAWKVGCDHRHPTGAHPHISVPSRSTCTIEDETVVDDDVKRCSLQHSRHPDRALRHPPRCP